MCSNPKPLLVVRVTETPQVIVIVFHQLGVLPPFCVQDKGGETHAKNNHGVEDIAGFGVPLSSIHESMESASTNTEGIEETASSLVSSSAPPLPRTACVANRKADSTLAACTFKLSSVAPRGLSQQ